MAHNTIVMDLNRCVGCTACNTACKTVNEVEIGNYWNKVIRVNITPEDQSSWPEGVQWYYLPIQCQHCADAPCVNVCPTGASYRNSVNGTVQIDPNKCIGCQYCLYACPYGVRSFDKEMGVARKCTLCQHLTADGVSKPACVHNCPGGARFFGDLEDPNSDVSRELAKYGPECIHNLPAPEGEEPLTRYILSPKNASWKELA